MVWDMYNKCFLLLSELSLDDTLRGFGMRGESILTNKWFILTMASVVFILTVLLVVIRRYSLEKERKAILTRMNDYSNRIGLTQEEKRIIAGISERAGVKYKDTVLTAAEAFNRGALKLMQEYFSLSSNIVDRKRLNTAISSIREKLGLKNRTFPFGTRLIGEKGLSSRGILTGKKVLLRNSSREEVDRIEAEVLENNEMEFILRPEIPVKCRAGDIWNVYYRLGAATWEFDVLTIAYEGGELTLNHSDSIRFINRRRFLRAEVCLPALIAGFPVIREDADSMKIAFYDATVTELSGPGIRVETNLKIGNSDRVIIIFELEEDKLIEDIGVVRGIREKGDGVSIGVELVGLNDTGIDELVRATNNAAISKIGEFTVEESLENKEEPVYG